MTNAQIDDARKLAVEYAVKWWPEAPADLQFHHVNAMPESNYEFDNRPRPDDAGWIHFSAAYSNRVGNDFYLSVHLESGEVRQSMMGQ